MQQVIYCGDMEYPITSTLLIFLAVVLGGIFLLRGKICSLGWQKALKFGARLPKGSSGWPVVGEFLAFVQDPAKFGFSHVRRYGNIFQSSFFSGRVIVGTTPEFAKFVLTSKVFINTNEGISAIAANILGPKSLKYIDGPEHMSIKKLIQKPLLPESLRSQVNLLETIICENLAAWEHRGNIIGSEGTRKIAFDVAMWFLLGVADIGSTPEGRKAEENFECLRNALGRIPVNLPGSAYHKGIKAKAALTEYFKYLVETRKGQENTQKDILGALLAAREDPQVREGIKDFDEDMMADNLVLTWFAASDTTGTTLAWVLKLLVDNPEVFRRIQSEQQEILQSKDPFAREGPRLTWEDTRKMVYSQKFFQEVQRFLAIAPVVDRQATQDIEYQGYLIPKGWAVWSLVKLIHSDPTIYPDPERFDPTRFDVTPKPYTYLPFSAGRHICPGMDVAKLVVLIFVHHLTTSYRYERAEADRGMNYIATMPAIVGGYPIKIYRQT